MRHKSKSAYLDTSFQNAKSEIGGRLLTIHAKLPCLATPHNTHHLVV